MGIGLTLKFIGGKKLLTALNSSKTIGKPLDNGIRKITLYYEGLVKKATPVKEGRLRASITHKFTARRATVGTNVKYAAPIEYGHKQQVGRFVPAIGARLVAPFVEARHMEGGNKVLGEGMFSYAWGQFKDWLSKGKHDIHVEIDKEFK